MISNEVPFLFFLLMRGIRLIIYLDEELGVRMVSLLNFILSAFFALVINLMFGETLMTFKFCTKSSGLVFFGQE